MTAKQPEAEPSHKVRAQPTAHDVDSKKVERPPLKPGDRLTRDEFERCYDAMPHLKKAELIEGVVYMPSPVRTEIHAEPHAHVIGWLAVYCAATRIVRLADNATVRLDSDNEVQPDALLWIEPTEGGNAEISDDGYI